MHHDFDKMLHSSTHTKEKTYAVLHRHWFDLCTRFLPIVGFLILVTIGAAIIGQMLQAAGQGVLLPVVYFGLTISYLFGWIAAFFIWVDYFLDIWIVTSGRVINVEQKGFFARDTSELDYTHVQDVTSEISGFFQTAFNYGDVIVQTAGTNSRFLFRRIGQPEKVKTLVMHLNRQAIAKHAHPGAVAQERAAHAQHHPEEEGVTGAQEGMYAQHATRPHPAENQPRV